MCQASIYTFIIVIVVFVFIINNNKLYLFSRSEVLARLFQSESQFDCFSLFLSVVLLCGL